MYSENPGAMNPFASNPNVNNNVTPNLVNHLNTQIPYPTDEYGADPDDDDFFDPMLFEPIAPCPTESYQQNGEPILGPDYPESRVREGDQVHVIYLNRVFPEMAGDLLDRFIRRHGWHLLEWHRDGSVFYQIHLGEWGWRNHCLYAFPQLYTKDQLLVFCWMLYQVFFKGIVPGMVSYPCTTVFDAFTERDRAMRDGKLNPCEDY
jgi:hypothetical protein